MVASPNSADSERGRGVTSLTEKTRPKPRAFRCYIATNCILFAMRRNIFYFGAVATLLSQGCSDMSDRSDVGNTNNFTPNKTYVFDFHYSKLIAIYLEHEGTGYLLRVPDNKDEGSLGLITWRIDHDNFCLRADHPEAPEVCWKTWDKPVDGTRLHVLDGDPISLAERYRRGNLSLKQERTATAHPPVSG
jgi:hypothetical protein